ncbi:MAG: aspartate-semialdehyde dehydrogenase, partial [Nitrospinaceae bacterium]|nr:aspartate-semialdehyde dehydrogenase [Nitrospinaceae bacterium]
KKEKYNISVVGATGAVGRRMLSTLEERNFPVARLTALASARSAGQTLPFRDQDIEVMELKADSFKGVDIALFSAGGSISKQYAPIAVESGCVVIDNSSAWRMDKEVPLIVPEVNPSALGEKWGIIANPNCSTIQMVVALKPIHDKYRIRRVVVSTYQSVSGSGQKAIEELKQQSRDVLDGKPTQCNVYPHQIAFNCLPHIDVFQENGYTKEEIKMVNETHKILEDDTIEVSPTAVRVPVIYSHSEAINVETEQPMNVKEVKELLSLSPGISVVDNPDQNEYPLAVNASGSGDVVVGRIRGDLTRANAINFWVVSDNLLKGAAYNAVQIAELLLKRVSP